MADNNTLALNFHTDVKAFEMVDAKYNDHIRYFKITTNNDVAIEAQLHVTPYITPATAEKVLKKMGNTKFPLNDMIAATQDLRRLSDSLRKSRALSTSRLLELDQVDRGLDDVIRKFQLAGLTLPTDTILNNGGQAQKVIKIHEAVAEASTPVKKLCDPILGLPDRVISAADRKTRLAQAAEAAAHVPA